MKMNISKSADFNINDCATLIRNIKYTMQQLTIEKIIENLCQNNHYATKIA